MNNITLIIAIFFVQLLTAQISDYVQLATQITIVLEETKTIQQLTKKQSQICGQLADIKQWNTQGSISPQSYAQLKTSYTNYALQMNTLVMTLEEDLKEISKIRKLKNVSINKFLDRFNTKYKQQLTLANEIYINEFTHTLCQVTDENGAKSGIIASILTILEISDIVYTSLKKYLLMEN